MSVIKVSQLMLYREIIAVCSRIHTKHINTVCGQNVGLLLLLLLLLLCPPVTDGDFSHVRRTLSLSTYRTAPLPAADYLL